VRRAAFDKTTAMRALRSLAGTSARSAGQSRGQSSTAALSSDLLAALPAVTRELDKFDATAGVAAALTAPSAWYVDRAFHDLDRDAVLGPSWAHVGHEGEWAEPGAFKCRTVAGSPIVVVRGADGDLKAFHNACAHHAMPVTPLKARGGGRIVDSPKDGFVLGRPRAESAEP